MKNLFIMRHAKSSWNDPDISDHDRPLNKRGKRDAPKMGKLIRDQNIAPDLIISSTAIRASKTAELVARGFKYKGETVLDESIYSAEPIDILKILSRCPNRYDSILLVGHNPTVEETIKLLTALPEITMPTCSLVHLTLAIEKWSEINKKELAKAHLVHQWSPKESF